jgi:hypothetical protein
MKNKISILVIALAMLMGVQSAKAWGGYGHGAIAYVAEQHLTPQAKSEVRRYLKHTLPWYASWMDHWRAVPPFHPTNAWHGFSATADGQVNWEKGDGKAMGQINKIIKSMGDGKYKNLPDSIVRHNLLILVHALPDMHCPVHVGFSKADYPNYRYSIYNKGKKIKFHGFWDGSPGYQRKGWTYERYAATVDKITPKEEKKIIKKGNTDYWGRDIIKQAHRCYALTPEGTDISKLTAEEKAKILELADEMAMKSAYRLAYVLNEIFKY